MGNTPTMAALIIAVGAIVGLSTPAGAEPQRREPGAADARSGPEFTEPFTRRIQIGQNGTLDLSNELGHVVITGGGGTEMKIDAVKRVRQPKEQEARTLLAGIVILVSERSGRVEVRTEFPLEGNWSGGVDYTIALPDTTNVTVRAGRGDMRITSVRGELRATTAVGNLVASSLGKLLEARTVSGSIEITDAEGEDVTARTIAGNVIVRNLKARSVDIDSQVGDVRSIDMECGQVYLSSESGNVEFTGRFAPGGRYQLRSHSGNVSLTPVGDTGFDLEATSSSGEIRSDYAFPDSLTSGGDPAGSNGTLRGTVGDASASVELRSFSGNVAIIKRQ